LVVPGRVDGELTYQLPLVAENTHVEPGDEECDSLSCVLAADADVEELGGDEAVDGFCSSASEEMSYLARYFFIVWWKRSALSQVWGGGFKPSAQVVDVPRGRSCRSPLPRASLCRTLRAG
jgi:hypothetical protein